MKTKLCKERRKCRRTLYAVIVLILTLMIKRIPFRFAVNAIIVIALLVTGFHLLVLTGIVPYSIVWGGRLTSVADMRSFELASILVNAVLICTVAVKARHLHRAVSVMVANVVLWIFTVLFFLNTIGNLLAKATIETVVFTPVTAVLALLCARVALQRGSHAGTP